MVKRLIIGMSGASGAPLTVDILRCLRQHHPEIETHMVVTRGAEMTLQQETGLGLHDLTAMCSVLHDNDSIGDSIASGSFRTMGMLIVPCSMKTVAGIVSGYSDNLLLRAADVCMKERRKLVLAAREAPLSTIHLRNLYEVSKLGAMVIPPVLTYYNRPQTIEECTRYAAKRLLAQFDLDDDLFEWEGL